MKEIGNTQARPIRKHLMTPGTLAHAAVIRQGADLTRRHGQGNGMRVHVLYFFAVSLAALALMIVAVVVANGTP